MSLLLVAMPGAPSSFLLLVGMSEYYVLFGPGRGRPLEVIARCSY